MLTNALILLTILLNSLVICKTVNETTQLKVSKNSSKFPHLFNTPFDIQITPLKPLVGKLSDWKMDTLVVRIRDKSNSEIERATCTYGGQAVTCDPFLGDFIQIPSWNINHKKYYIAFYVMFTKHTNQMFIEIYQISAKSKEDLAMKADNLKQEKLIYNSQILLSIPPTLDMRITLEEGRQDKSNEGEIGIITCRSYGINVPIKPVFVNKNQFNILSENYDKDKNEIEMRIQLSILDHKEKVLCRSGVAKADIEIKVSHSPTKVTVFPNVNKELKIGKRVYCRYGDGYPTPNTYWSFIQGPQNASKYYEISRNGRNLHFRKEVPKDSKWLFNCSAFYILSKSNGVLNRTILIQINGNHFNMSDNQTRTPPVPEWKIYMNQKEKDLNSLYQQVSLKQEDVKNSLKTVISKFDEFKQKYIKEYNQTTVEDDKTNRELTELKNLIDDHDKKIANLSISLIAARKGLRNPSIDFVRTSRELNRQNKMIQGLKEGLYVLEKGVKDMNITVLQIFIKYLLLMHDKLVLTEQIKFVKQNLYWVSPITWSVSNITVIDYDKEALSDPFYSPIKGYKMYLFSSFSKDIIRFHLFLPNSPRNNYIGKPVRFSISITIKHKRFVSITKEVKIQSTIYSFPGVSDNLIFSHHELERGGFISDGLISLICDVTEL